MLNTRMNRLAIAFAAIAALLMPQAATAQSNSEHRYEQRGSIVTVVRQGQRLSIAYVEPSAERRAEGVAPGAEFFTGKLDRNNYAEGMAWLYRPNCGGIDYFVYGDFAAGQPFTLAGTAPVLAADCSITDNVYDTPEANLVFTPASDDPPQQQGAYQGGERVCTAALAQGGLLAVQIGPGDDYARIAFLARGECNITVLHECTGDWCPVRGPSNMVGWANARFLGARQ